MGSCQSTEAAAPAPAAGKAAVTTSKTSPGSSSSQAQKQPERHVMQYESSAAAKMGTETSGGYSSDSGTPDPHPPPGPAGEAVTASGGSGGSGRPRFDSYASGASTPDDDRSEDEGSSSGSVRGGNHYDRRASNPKTIIHSTSQIGLDELMDERREAGDLRQNVVHIEVPFGKPIEEVYDGVHNGPVLGSGISGLVRLVTHKATGLKYAVKVLDLGLVDTAEGLNQLREEIFIMCQLDHPNIVRLEEVYESHSEIYLVQELCLGGELFDRLDEQPDYHYTEAECARLVKMMLSAVRYLHSKGIIHRDLKLENFLFSNTSPDSELKMIDFGLSKHFRYGEVQHEAVGTPYTVAPEVIRGSYDERCDIWAIGVIAFLLLSGDPPFGGCGGPEPLMQVRTNILRGAYAFEPEDIWESVSSLARIFIKDTLVTDPKDRPTARKAQKHQWLQEWASRNRHGTDNVLNPNVVKALVNFKEFSDMRKLLCEVLSFTLLPDQIKELRREFEKMDTDGSGEISLAALKQVLMTNAGAGSLGALTEEEVEDIFNAMRVRKTETRIHWHEFIAAGLSQCQVDDRNLRLAFERLDSDHKGYITLDDIMDLMGSDALQSEEAMREMWGDSIKAVKCQHARITYDDFLMLMKGQSKEVAPPPVGMDLEGSVPSLLGSGNLGLDMEGSVSSLLGSPAKLIAVPEVDSFLSDEAKTPSPSRISSQASAAIMTNGSPNESKVPFLADIAMNDSNHTPIPPKSPLMVPCRSAPSTPADHKKILDMEEMDSPLSMDDDDDITSSGPGVPGSSVSLTPPASPVRSAHDYVTPLSQRATTAMSVNGAAAASLMLPGFGAPKPEPYSRRRSRSVGDEDASSGKDLHVVADAVRDMLLPETDHEHLRKELESVVKDGSKSNLQVNRKLYRAHRQMRVAVLDASKRFEEQQAAHAREVIAAQRENEESSKGMIQAGLVMRHGLKKQVSSEAVRTMLRDNRINQQHLVEKATRRGGRGRRSRKKTISDMSAMMSSMGQDEMGLVAAEANNSASSDTRASLPPQITESKSDDVRDKVRVPELPEMSAQGAQIRAATVPGKFIPTEDPFSKEGRYGAVAQWK